MGAVRRVFARVYSFFHKPPLDADLEAEIAAHVELAVEENLNRGFTHAEARRLALVRFGGMDLAKDQQREARGLMQLDILLQDCRYTFRSLRRDRGFTLVAILILALGIGANIAVFSVVNNLLLRPLPFRDAQQLVWIAPTPTKCGLSCATYSSGAYDAFRARTRSFQDVTGYFAFSNADNLSLKLGNGAPITATSIDVIANFFQLLGVQPAMGRAFTAADARDGAAPVILLSNPWWRRQFNADPNIVGKSFDMNGQQTTVIGVLPASFDFGAVFAPGTKVDAITPLNLYGPAQFWGNIITFIGRLKPGVSLAQATDDSKNPLPYMCNNPKYPGSCGQYEAVPVPLKDYVSGKLRGSLVLLWSAVGGILLIACVNLSNLLLARSAARTKEFAMRTALGASRSRIVGQLLTESLILSGAGAICGLGLAAIVVAWLRHQGAIALPLLSTLHIDIAALGWTVLIAIFAAMFFGLLPGLRMASGNLQDSLKDSGAGSGQSRKHERLRSILVVTEVALACVLLVGAGLLLRSFVKVLDVDLGFQPQHAAAITVDYDDSAPDYVTGAQKRSAIFQQVIARVSRIPGVETAGISDYLPLGRNRAWGLPMPKGFVIPKDFDVAGPLVYVVTPGYLHAMGTRITGRDFTWDDGPKSENVVMIDKSYADFLNKYAHWTDGSAVGKELDTGGGRSVRVVGVVDEVHEESTENESGWQIYYPAIQAGPNGAQLVVRTTLPPASLASSVLVALRELNPKQPNAEFRPIQTLVNHANSSRQFFMLLVASFAGLGLLLAAIGIYGVISYSVTQRTQEIGIRMALGATMANVQLSVLVKTLRLALIGIFAGAVASLLVSRAIAALLFNTAPSDPMTFAAMVLLIGSVALLAGFIPARRASRINPMVALRNN
jgi:predicted permease